MKRMAVSYLGGFLSCMAVLTVASIDLEAQERFEYEASGIGTVITNNVDSSDTGKGSETWQLTEVTNRDGREVQVWSRTSGGAAAESFAAGGNVFGMRTATSEWEAKPHLGHYDWPLYVGKTWTSDFVFLDRKNGGRWAITDHYEVTGWEEVTVPAGTFKALKIVSKPGTNSAYKRTIFWSPELKAQIKFVGERTSYHVNGYGYEVYELASIDRK